jgi:hypothetical protein
MKIEEGLELLKKIIDKDLRHEDYTRVMELAEKYYKLKTGDGIEDLLEKIETRVTDDEFKQIKRIYRSIIPSTLNSTKMPFLQAARTEPDKLIDFENDADKKVMELQEYIDEYWGDKSLDKYLEYAFVDYNYIDPNAFLITEFDVFDPKVEKASPYPFVASSEQAIMFEYRNEILEYLVVKLPIKFMDGDTEKDGFRYTMYLGMDTIVLSQVATKNVGLGSEVIEIRSIFYDVFYYQPKNEKIPAIRFGYNRDEQTKGRTFVSVFHPVIGLLEKTLKIDSELDLSCAMVAFPQRFAYSTPCPGDEKGCINGKTLDGHLCPVCNGTSIAPAHKGTQDIIYLQLPRDPQTPLRDLNNMLVYKGPDITLLEFDADYLKSLKETIYAQMFNLDRYLRSDVSVTATEVNVESDNLNNTLYGFAQHYSAVWKFVVQDIATFTDLGEGLILNHQFPKDFKFKTVEQLFTDLKIAKDASAAPSTIDAIQADINKKLYADRPDDLKRMDIKNKFNPFGGYSEANVRFIIAQGDTTTYNKILWENFESIFQDLEFENVDPWLYDMADDMIRTKVIEKTNEYVKIIEGEKQAEYEQYLEQNEGTNQNEA